MAAPAAAWQSPTEDAVEYMKQRPLRTLGTDSISALLFTDIQAIYSLNVAAAAIAWGSPLSVVGSLYDHTVTTANTAPRALGTAANITVSKSQYQGRGLGLVDISGNDTVLYKALKEYMSSAEEWLEQQITVSC